MSDREAELTALISDDLDPDRRRPIFSSSSNVNMLVDASPPFCEFAFRMSHRSPLISRSRLRASRSRRSIRLRSSAFSAACFSCRTRTYVSCAWRSA